VADTVTGTTDKRHDVAPHGRNVGVRFVPTVGVELERVGTPDLGGGVDVRDSCGGLGRGARIKQ
jgi:hypothetical protein